MTSIRFGRSKKAACSLEGEKNMALAETRPNTCPGRVVDVSVETFSPIALADINIHFCDEDSSNERLLEKRGKYLRASLLPVA
jgi:hypothetical protein